MERLCARVFACELLAKLTETRVGFSRELCMLAARIIFGFDLLYIASGLSRYEYDRDSANRRTSQSVGISPLNSLSHEQISAYFVLRCYVSLFRVIYDALGEINKVFALEILRLFKRLLCSSLLLPVILHARPNKLRCEF